MPTIREYSTPADRAGLSLFFDDGRIEIDSSMVERTIRPLALTRKNALFAGSDAGAGHWAVIASLVETCKLVGVEPRAYLADVITRIVKGHPNRRLDYLRGPTRLSQPSGTWPEDAACGRSAAPCRSASS